VRQGDTAESGRGRGAGAPPPAGFGGIALAHNVRTDAEVDAVLEAAARAGGTVTRAAAVNPIGFYSGVFTDPDGHAWEIAHNPGFTLTEDGSLVLPDFG
ncbi:VOC family protein, partial [Streptomyces sp. WAC06614]|uniref:VOC family protein n=1 Tax=Streptomyces sp. WAC06614 TaxID=2487416 RepID=UPI000F96EE52